jgi:addiction module HigA family antidote
MLIEEFLKPFGWTQVQFAEHLGIPIQRVNEIATGRRGVTPETALLLAAALRTSPEFWLNLQSAHDLALARTRFGAGRRKIEAISEQRARAASRRKAK